MNIKEKARRMKLARRRWLHRRTKRAMLRWNRSALALEAHREEIFAANAQDLAAADENGVTGATRKRLKFDDGKLRDCISGLRQLETLADPLNKITLARELDENLTLYRATVPIGVIGVIFEARPDALVQIASLCVKSGNCAILKGGKETANTNRVLFNLIKDAVIRAGLPESCLLQAEAHSEIDELLACDQDVDLLIPRGSNKFVRYIMENTKIPVMGHSSGICHVYADKAATRKKRCRSSLMPKPSTQQPAMPWKRCSSTAPSLMRSCQKLSLRSQLPASRCAAQKKRRRSSAWM